MHPVVDYASLEIVQNLENVVIEKFENEFVKEIDKWKLKMIKRAKF